MPAAPRTNPGRAAAAAVLLLTVGATAALPPHTVSTLYRSGQSVSGFGVVNSPFLVPNGGDGILSLSVNNSGEAQAHVRIQAPGSIEGVLRRSLGLSPYIAEEEFGFFSGTCGSSVPCSGHGLETLYSQRLNANGVAAFVMGLESLGSGATPVRGIFYDKQRLLLGEGSPITSPGVAPGTTLAVVDSGTYVDVNAAGQFLVSATIRESGVDKRALLVIGTDALGQVTSQTLVAKVGGPVGAGPATWTELGVGPHAAAISDSGQVIFSGAASDGRRGLFRGGSFVAVEGGASPEAGQIWGQLVGAPVDLNAGGDYVFRGRLAASTAMWPEGGDAGETLRLPSRTLGSGSLQQISGALSDEHDVDVYKIRIDGNGSGFSATTVPGPGFTGAAFDSVLYLFRDGFNANGSTRAGLARNNDAAPGVIQSTLGAANIPADHTPGRTYFLAISTPKARPLGNDLNFGTQTREDVEIWQPDPVALLAHGGILYWPDVSAGVIRRLDLATGAALADRAVSQPPAIAASEPAMTPAVAIATDGAMPRIYWHVRQSGQYRIRRANLDGTGVSDVVLQASGGTSRVTDLAADTGVGKIFWTQVRVGEIWSANLDGSGPAVVIKDPAEIVGGVEGFFAPAEIEIDGPGGKIYWTNRKTNAIERANLDGSGRETVVAGAGGTGLAIDAAGRRLYWTDTAAGRVRRLNLDNVADVADVVAATEPASVAVDAAGGRVYWSNTTTRTISRSSVSLPLAETWASAGPDLGDIPADGPHWVSPFERWARAGSPGAGSLPYQIRLTGASFADPRSMIVRNSTKVALAGETLDAIAPATLTLTGTDTGPVKISDTGAVLWFGRWTTGGVVDERALFIEQEILLSDGTPIDGTTLFGTDPSGDPNEFDMSPNGRWIVANGFNGSFSTPPGYTAGDNAVIIGFTDQAPAPTPSCRAEFDNQNGVQVADIFAFLRAWFAGSASADFDQMNGIQVADIFAFLRAWFAGCP